MMVKRLTQYRSFGRFLLLLFVMGSVVLVIEMLRSSQNRRGSILASAGVPVATRTYEAGSRLYLDTGTVKVGLETSWGGAIVEVLWHGMNFVNAYDTGREIQAALYDGDAYPRSCGDCMDAMGWDPVQGGDRHKNGSPVLEQKLGADFLYTRTRPLHWHPDNKGGGKDQPVPGDAEIEQWVFVVPGYPSAAKVHYKISYLGNDQHANHVQEVPAVYMNWDFGKFVHYGGTTPWTNGEVSFFTMPDRPKNSPPLYMPEHWGAFVNSQGAGLTVFAPDQYPYASGWNRPPDAAKNSGTHYFVFTAPFSFGPGSVWEGDVYLFAGDYKGARQAIYSLEKSIPPRDTLPPFGVVDEPKPYVKANGSLLVRGWALDNTEVSKVKVYVDDHLVGEATYGDPRPDITQVFPYAPAGTGFRYVLDASRHPNGAHLVGVNAEDKAGNVAVFRRIPIEIENGKKSD